MNESEMIGKDVFQQIYYLFFCVIIFREASRGRVLTSFAVGSLPAVGADALVRVHVIDTRPSVAARAALAVVNV